MKNVIFILFTIISFLCKSQNYDSIYTAPFRQFDTASHSERAIMVEQIIQSFLYQNRRKISTDSFTLIKFHIIDSIRISKAIAIIKSDSAGFAADGSFSDYLKLWGIFPSLTLWDGYDEVWRYNNTAPSERLMVFINYYIKFHSTK